MNDLKFAFRQLLKNPGFTAVAVLTLALGIGANTAIFILVDTVLLRLLPVAKPNELVFVSTSNGTSAPPYPCLERIRAEGSSFSSIAAFATDELTVGVDGVLEQVFGQAASGNYFTELGVKAATGRMMSLSDEKLDPPVAVISYGYGQRRFGSAAKAIGRALTVGDRLYTIVGVTAPEFQGLEPGRRVDVTLPITTGPVRDPSRRWFHAVARLPSKVSIGQATSEANAIFHSYQEDRQGAAEIEKQPTDRIVLAAAARGLEPMRARFARPLSALSILGGIVLVITCANLGTLMLLRGARRAREFGIRIAMGANSGQVVRLLVTETLLLLVLGATAGLVAARIALTGLMEFFATGRRPIWVDVQYDWRLGAFIAGVVLVIGSVTGLWPALRALRTDPQGALRDGEPRVTGSRRAASAESCLIIAQVALSLVLLVTAVIFVKTMVNLRSVDRGFSESQLLTMSLLPEFAGDADGRAHQQFWIRVLERIRARSEIKSASLSVLTPLSGRDTSTHIRVSGFQPRTETDRTVHLNHISEDYFRTFGIDLVMGRAFTPGDVNGALKVAVISAAAAKAFFPGRDPIGQVVELGKGKIPCQVVGVVRDSKLGSLREPPSRMVYVPLWQPLEKIGRVTLAVSSRQALGNVAISVAGEIRAIHPDTLVSDVISTSEQINATLMSDRLLSNLATGFAALTLILTAIGLYGILNYSIMRRRIEFGVRMALGATPASIGREALRRALIPVLVGIGIGLPAAFALARVLQRLFFGVSPADPGNYLLSGVLLIGVASLAVWAPVRRAAGVDPVNVLRHE